MSHLNSISNIRDVRLNLQLPDTLTCTMKTCLLLIPYKLCTSFSELVRHHASVLRTYPSIASEVPHVVADDRRPGFKVTPRKPPLVDSSAALVPADCYINYHSLLSHS